MEYEYSKNLGAVLDDVYETIQNRDDTLGAKKALGDVLNSMRNNMLDSSN